MINSLISSVEVHNWSNNWTHGITNFLSLVSELSSILSWEFCKDWGNFSDFSHQHKHVLSDIVHHGAWGAWKWVNLAELDNSKHGGVESAGLNWIEDIHGFSKVVEHLLGVKSGLDASDDFNEFILSLSV